MKKHIWRKSTAMALSGILAMSSLPMLGSISAGAIKVPESIPMSNDFYYKNETLQPYGACFQADELLNWSPDNDPDARYNQSGVAKKDRWMGPSVNPNASRDAKVYPLAMSNPRASEGASQGGDGDFVYAFTNFQYVDTYNFWGGSSSEGAIAIPSPEHIDSAHRNGVPATGTIFIPWGDSSYSNQFLSELLVQNPDGSFPGADKLIEIAEYYGFDGYMINHESGGNALFDDFLAYIQKVKPDGFTMAWYNGSGSLSSGSIDSWLQNGDTRINDEWWLDMSWGGIDNTIANTKEAGRSPFDIHASWEYFPRAGGSSKGGPVSNLVGDDGKVKVSLGILSPTVTLTQATDSSDFQNVKDQELWVGPTNDPRYSDDYINHDIWPGFSSLVADRTPVLGSEFVTHFTTGNGYQFYDNGEMVGKEDGWYNRSMTDVLPTWRWIIDSEGQKLNGSIDYEDAYYAGTSLKFDGNLDAGKANHIKLYSAQLDIKEDSKLSVTYKTPDNKGVKMSVGLCFGDTYDDANFKFYDVETSVNGEWTTATVDLGEDAGKTAIAISMKFASDADVSDYSMNIGRFAVTTAAADAVTPEKVTGMTYDEVIYHNDTDAEARVYWDKSDNAAMYQIRRIHSDGTKEFIGATPNNAYYLGEFVKDGDEESFYFEITPVSENGTAGEATNFKFVWPSETNGYEPIQEAGENIALGSPAVSSATCVGDGPVKNLTDGVITLSKWCIDKAYSGYAVIDLGENKDISRWVVYHANCPGAGEGVDYNTIDFDLQYAADDGEPLLDGDTAASRQRVRGMSFQTADSVNGNRDDITDRNLDEPISARYIKLNVRSSGSSPWTAIRIYELELYEHNYTTSPTPLLARNVTVQNNEGANDRVTLNNVPMPNGKAYLYDSLDAEEPIAVGEAYYPDTSYSERSVGRVDFTGLDLNTADGRLYYTVEQPGSYAAESPRYSVPIPLENDGSNAVTADSETLVRSAKGVQLRDNYGVLTLTGLPEGASAKVYTSEDSMIPVTFASEIQNGGDTLRIERIPLDKEGGTFYYELSCNGYADSGRIAVNYGDPADLVADETNLVELLEKYAPYIANEDQYVPSTWTGFEEAYQAVEALAAEENVTGAQVDEARDNLLDNFAKLRSIADTQRMEEYFAEVGQLTYDPSYVQEDWEAYDTARNELRAMLDGIADGSNPVDKLTLENARIKLDATLDIGVRQGGDVILPEVENATITVDKPHAYEGDVVTVTVTPDKHYRVQKGSLCVDGVPMEGNTFVMPGRDVTISVVIEKAAVMDVLNYVIGVAEQMKADGALDNTMEAVVSEFNSALEAAKAIDAETAYQPEINAATNRLLAAMAKVDWKQGDKTVLEVAVEVAKAIEPDLDLYEEAGKQEFIDALAKAEELLDSGNAWQDDIDEATDALIEAMSNLRMKANKDILNDMIAQAGSINLDNYTADSANALRTALADAIAVAENDNATQDEINTAVANLAVAKAGLVKVNGSASSAEETETAPVVENTGEGAAPTKTGDAGSLAVFGVMALAAAAAVALRKKRG